MRRQDVTLIMLSLAEGKAYTPVQIQKAVFILSDLAPSLFNADSTYNFEPYDYGPFDKSVYTDIEQMQREGLAKIEAHPHRGWNTYSATVEGFNASEQFKQGLAKSMLDFLESVSEYVRRLSFRELVSAIYREYPQMRENSIFVEK